MGAVSPAVGDGEMKRASVRCPGLLIALTAITCGLPTPAEAQALAPKDAAAANWKSLARMDVEAAHRMLLEDHPAAVEAVGDDAFRKRLAAAYSLARSRAEQVSSYEGLQAVLSGLAVSLGDKHIWSRPLFTSVSLQWPGIVMARRGNDWIVADEEEAVEGELLVGSRLLSCDDVDADQFAQKRLGVFRADWSIHAQRIQSAPWLLIDDGNPFLKQPWSCTFERNGRNIERKLRWRSIKRSDLLPKLKTAARRGAAGFGVRQVGQGWWIGLQSLSAKAAPVVEAVQAKAAEMRRAPYVVLDLRGNGGGSSQFGMKIAEALLGETHVAAKAGLEQDGGCSAAWRVSKRNIARLDHYRRELGPRIGPEAAAQFEAAYRDAINARAKGEAFTGATSCPQASTRARPAEAPEPEFGGKLILLTDNACFSSCLLVTDAFSKLGALQVGEATDAATRYFEVREDKMPSGLIMFSTLQALSPSSPAQIGPFVPSLLYEGDISDTSALETWIAGLARS